MPKGYNGKILHVNLTERKCWIEEPEIDFYRMYFGGSALGTYYCLKEIPKGTDPLGPENVLVFSTSIVTGAPVPFFSRVCVNAKSPITGGIGDSQGGGWFPAELKHAGFDAVVVKGKADRPVYIYIKNGEVEIRDADHLWGKDFGQMEDAIREELSEKTARVIGIGKGGENLVKYACIVNERRHSNGRTGMGAVMGSKNLKAIVAKGDKKKMDYFNGEELLKMVKKESEIIAEDPGAQGLNAEGTYGFITVQNSMGGLPTRNFKEGYFDDCEKLSAEELHKMHYKNYSCYACPVKCKIAVKGENIDPTYGGPEYETASALGSYLENSDIQVLAKAHEMCNRYTLDTISTGASIAFAMECYENGILTADDTDGLDLRFGNSSVILPLIEKIADREGLGGILAEGPRKAAEIIGKGSEKYAMEVKGNPLPAHMPRQKNSFALIYAINPFGADHMSSWEDGFYTNDVDEEGRQSFRALDLNVFGEYDGITTEKAKMIYYTNMYFSFADSLCFCMFSSFFMDYEKISKYIKLITGWDTSLYEFMKVGERKNNMMKFFNFREGFTTEDDYLPERLYEEFTVGPTKGNKIDREQFNQGVIDFYEMAGWDIKESRPSDGKLKELSLDWLLAENI
jgi:aldehyde:ferredoxin oxidoreductase